MLGEVVKLINLKDLGFEGKASTFIREKTEDTEIPNSDRSRNFRLLQQHEGIDPKKGTYSQTRLQLNAKFRGDRTRYPYSAPLFEICGNKYGSGEVQVLIHLHALAKPSANACLWQDIYYTPNGRMNLGYQSGDKVDEKAAKEAGFKPLDQFPKRIDFNATLQGLIEQAKALDFSDPKLIPANPLNPSSVGTA